MNTTPQTGDLWLSWNSHGSTFVYVMIDGPKGPTPRHIATAWAFRGTRAVNRPGVPESTRPAPDMTWKQLHSPNCGAILGQYFPDHDGASVWTSGPEYRGTVAAGVAPVKIKRHVAGTGYVAPENWTIKPGAILSASWGYDQTNIDFYVVLTRTGNNITLQECAQIHSNLSQGGFVGDCIPDAAHLTGEILRKRVYVKDGKDQHVRIASFAWATLWDGKPEHWTAYA